MEMSHKECPAGCKESRTWSRLFMLIGTLSVFTAIVQSCIQIFALRASVKYEDITYIWLFIICTWVTLIYLAYTVRLLYLVKCRRCSEISRMWWYTAVIIMILNPSLTVWWWINGDSVLYSISLPASFVYIAFFVLVCRSTTPHKDKHIHEEDSQLNDVSAPLQSEEVVQEV